MLRNLRIGAKIFLGFATVIVLMIIITVTVTISSLTTVENLNNIEADSTLQTMGNELSDTFYTARMSVKIICYIINDEAYADAQRTLARCGELIDDMHSYIGEKPILEKFLPYLDAVEGYLEAYKESAALIQQSNTQLGALEQELGELGVALTGLSDALDGGHIGILYDSTALELTPDARTLQMDNLTDGAMISQGIWNMRQNANSMTGAGITYTRYERDLEWIDNTISLANESKSESEQIAGLRAQLPVFRDLIVEFHGEMMRNKALVEACVASGETLLTDLNAMMAAIDSAMAKQVSVTTSSASLYLTVAIAVSAVSILLAAFTALLISRGITKPVQLMVHAADGIAVGNTEVDVEYASKDEIGRLFSSFKRMLAAIRDQVSIVTGIADGDLTMAVVPRSEDDKMGLALSKMVDNLNNMFRDVSSASAQVSLGSRQLAEGAQALAQGSTEQAASVEQLSSSIDEVARKTKSNAEMAGKTAKLAFKILQSAEKGSAQMDRMMEAVRDINQSSHNIGKIIKVIDDIAFQTNILALNAAVEAARAGQHGKGFAVVAEEVRNLAAKSAEAAKETGSLVSDSMEKAELGSRIAGDTSTSLMEIVEGVNEAGKFVEEIAKSSDEQSAAIAQINLGVEQVAQVVQQNSATAEESAAASEEISGQTGMLEKSIAQFKLRDI